jgi:hypothetical protein
MESNINDEIPTNPDNPKEWNEKLVNYPTSTKLWDGWWSNKKFKKYYALDIMHDSPVMDYIKDFIKNGARTVLLVGNGVSQQPKMFSYAGFDVTAIDISSYANSYALDYQFHPELYIQESSINGINQLPKRDGGSLEFITGDFMSPEIFGNKRFDVIMSFKTLQYFSGDLLEKAALDLVELLNPNGFLLIGISNLFHIVDKIEALFKKHNIQIKIIDDYLKSPHNSKECQLYRYS